MGFNFYKMLTYLGKKPQIKGNVSYTISVRYILVYEKLKNIFFISCIKFL